MDSAWITQEKFPSGSLMEIRSKDICASSFVRRKLVGVLFEIIHGGLLLHSVVVLIRAVISFFLKLNDLLMLTPKSFNIGGCTRECLQCLQSALPRLLDP